MTRILLHTLHALLLLAASALPAWAQTITVYSSGNVTVGSSRQLTAYVPLSPNTVTWRVNGVTGGNATIGTVSTTGLYQAPTVIPQPNRVTVSAASTAFADRAGSVTLTITQVQPRLWSTSPGSVAAGAFSLSLNGAAFTPTSVVRFGGVNLATTYVSATRLTATGTATAAQVGQAVPVDVLATGPGAISSDVVNVAVTAAAPPPVVTVSVSPPTASVAAGSSRSFTATVSGSSDGRVSWAVNGVAGGNATLGTISAGGVYSAPAVPPNPATVTLRATSLARPTAGANATVSITAAPGGGGGGTGSGTADLAALRLLDQAGFGPTPTDLARLKSIGQANWLSEQFGLPESPIPIPASGGNSAVAAQYLARLSSAPDQLRQRTAYALAQLLVISTNKNNYPNEVVPFLQILSRHAFGNYRALLGEVTTSPQMGKYLDLANSNKPAPGSAANENFPRELLQLFSIGLVRLNLDGTPMLDAQGQPIPTYGQADVQQLALALTGWTYAGTGTNNWEDFSGPMVPRDVNHDMRAKSFLGCSVPANLGTVAETTLALDCVFQHPNVGPFVSLRLIRQLVKSNPSPAYVARVATVFNNNGSGTRGDLRAVLRAILTDAEARDDAVSASGGRLRDPVQQIVALVRALGGSINPGNVMGWELSRTGEAVLQPPSVFGFYSPLYRVPGSGLAGPEFQIYTPTEAVLRGNLIWRLLGQPAGDVSINLAPYTALAADTTALLNRVDQALLFGRMPAGLRSVIAAQVDAQGGNTAERVRIALYFTALSGLHAVQH